MHTAKNVVFAVVSESLERTISIQSATQWVPGGAAHYSVIASVVLLCVLVLLNVLIVQLNANSFKYEWILCRIKITKMLLHFSATNHYINH